MNGRLRDGSRAHILSMYRSDTSIWYTCFQVPANRDKLIPGRAGGAGMSGQRSGVLELAVLGLLHENPMHGYELAKRLNPVRGPSREWGWGALSRSLNGLLFKGLIAGDPPAGPPKPVGRRSK